MLSFWQFDLEEPLTVEYYGCAKNNFVDVVFTRDSGRSFKKSVGYAHITHTFNNRKLAKLRYNVDTNSNVQNVNRLLINIVVKLC